MRPSLSTILTLRGPSKVAPSNEGCVISSSAQDVPENHSDFAIIFRFLDLCEARDRARAEQVAAKQIENG